MGSYDAKSVADEVEQQAIGFRQCLPDLSSPRFTAAKQQDALSYVETFRTTQHPPWLFNLTEAWRSLLEQPYKGVTNDGQVRPDLFHVQDEGIRTSSIVDATLDLLKRLTPEQKGKVSYPINAREWRAWSNPEFLLRDFGLRLERLPEDAAASVLSVLEATFSTKGYQKALAAMRINAFLGEVCGVPRIMNEYSYNFLVFGTPSTTSSWGWSLYGHHLCLNVFIRGPQIVISPTFTGAEPNIIDTGPFKGTSILHKEGTLGLALMQSLPAALKARAQIYKLMRDPGMRQTGDLISDRWNKDDQRHVCGAFRDNRIVPYEGVCVSGLNEQQQQLILDIAEEFLLYLPDKSREMKKAQIQRHFHETHFCWIGAYGDEDPFYYRVQSPVIIFEFDHHSGVFLTNEEPAKFHTHTIIRTPNAGDYGTALRRADEKL